MELLNTPITISVAGLWQGPTGRGPFARVVLAALGRLLVMVGYLGLALTLLTALAFEVLMLLTDTWIALSCWLIVGLIAYWLRPPKAGKSPPPDRFEGGAGCRVPVPPGPVLVCHTTQELPDERIAASSA